MQKAGVYYLNGAGTLRDPIAAAGWFSRAAALGSPEGLLSLGVMAESGMVPVAADSTPAKAASEAYQQIVSAPQVSDETRFEALLRLGGVYFRGALVAADAAPAPDYENAYKQFKQASDLAPANELAANLLKEASAKLTPEQIKKVDAAVAEAAAARKAALESAAPAASGGAAPAAAPATAPRAEPTGQRAAPAGEVPATAANGGAAAPANMPATAPASAPASGAEGEKKPGFRLPLFGR
jgi:hypothetical protein